MKPFNFNKWFNIWLVIIFGLTLMSLASTLLLGPMLSGVQDAVLNNTDARTRAVMPAPPGYGIFDYFSSPAFIGGMVVLHLVVCVIAVAIAYFVLKALSQRSDG